MNMIEKEFKRYRLFADFPWLNPDNEVTPHYLIIGDDIDSLLSAALWNHVSNRDWKIIGIYHKYETLYFAAGYREELQRAIWLDLDIAEENILSIGHHITRLNNNDRNPGLRKGFNLNERRTISLQNFKRKYPLGTIHFLMYLFDMEIPPGKFANQMIISADSTWINGQKHRFSKNMKDWLLNTIRLKTLYKIFQKLDTPEFEVEMKSYFDYLKSNNIPQGTGQVKSLHQQLFGFQCQFNPENSDMLNRLFSLINEITGWDIPKYFPFSKSNSLRGSRFYNQEIKKSIIDQYGNLDEFLKRKNIFSYVFPNNGKLNYTEGITI